jgi:hypothetical protein
MCAVMHSLVILCADFSYRTASALYKCEWPWLILWLTQTLSIGCFRVTICIQRQNTFNSNIYFNDILCVYSFSLEHRKWKKLTEGFFGFRTGASLNFETEMRNIICLKTLPRLIIQNIKILPQELSLLLNFLIQFCLHCCITQFGYCQLMVIMCIK